MIVTVTLNAALDRTLTIPHFTPGTSRTAEHSLNLGGGKGLNVARALRTLGVPVLALGFLGGITGTRVRRLLDAEGMGHDMTEVRAETRTCTTIIDPAAGLSTEVNEPGCEVEAAELAAFFASYASALPRADLVCLSGSLPSGVPVAIYADLIDRARTAGVACVLDTRGPALQAGVDAGPLLIKPNLLEAEELLGRHAGPLNADSLWHALPAPWPAAVAITLGPDGAVLHGRTDSWRAQPLTVEPLDTVGAGDSFVAGMVAALVQASAGADVRQVIQMPEVLQAMLRSATAAAAANVLTLGAGVFDTAVMTRLYREVRIEKFT